MISKKRVFLKILFLLTFVMLANKCSNTFRFTSIRFASLNETNSTRSISQKSTRVKTNKSLIKLTSELFEFNLLTDYDNLRLAKSLFKKVIEILHENSLEYFVVGGTLLGAVKNKGMLPWDDDNDLWLTHANLPKFLSLESQFASARINLTKNDFFYKLYYLHGKNSGYKNYKYPFVDIFFCHKQNGNYMLKDLRLNTTINFNLFRNYFFRVFELYPLAVYEFEDFKVYGPQYAISFLNRVYPNWPRSGKIKLHFQNRVRVGHKTFQTHYYNRSQSKPYLWLTTSSYHHTMNVFKYCSRLFEIILLNDLTVNKYLPELGELKLNLSTQNYLIGFMLVYKYGGLFIDSENVRVMSTLEDVLISLKSVEFVGFGCGQIEKSVENNNCKLMSRFIYASRPKRILVENVIKKLILISMNQTLNGQLVELVMREEVDKLVTNFRYDYYHYARVDSLYFKQSILILNNRNETFIRLFRPPELIRDQVIGYLD